MCKIPKDTELSFNNKVDTFVKIVLLHNVIHKKD